MPIKTKHHTRLPIGTHITYVLLIGGLLFVHGTTWTQEQNLQLSIQVAGKDSTFLAASKIRYMPVHESEASWQQEVKKVRMALAYQSYLSNTVDSIVQAEEQITAYMSLGPSYKWAQLKEGNVDKNLLAKVGFRSGIYEGKPLYYKELGELLKSLQEYAENHGYPFASVRLDSIQVLDDHSITAQLYLEENRYITYKGIDIVGEDVRISVKYLQRYLGIQPGEAYDLSRIRQIPKLIRDLPFLKEKKTAVVTFKGSEATVNLFLEKKRASRFDFLVGVLPRNPNTGNRLLITVDGMFAAQNMLGAGERVLLEFRQVKQGTQRLDVELGYPYVLGLPFGVDGDFALYRRDSTFLDVEYDVGFSYFFNANQYLKAFGHSKQSILLQVNEERILQSRQLPNNLDTRYTNFGLEFQAEKVDYRFTPRKGWRLTTRASAGFRTVRKNTDIINLSDPNNPEFRFEQLYDSINLRTFQYQLYQNGELYFPFYPKQRGVIMLRNRTGAIISPQPVFLNEQFRLGGNKTLRGFDEEALNASLYSISTAEYRFLLGRNSYFYLFGDYGYLQSKAPEATTSNWPLGFGLGIVFETAVGLFGVSGAFGRVGDIPINYRSPRIHFGYVSFF